MSDPLEEFGALPEPGARFEDIAARMDECRRWDVDLSLSVMGEAPPPDHLRSCTACRETLEDRIEAVRLLVLLPEPPARLSPPKLRPAPLLVGAAAVAASFLAFVFLLSRPAVLPPGEVAVALPRHLPIPAPPTLLTRFTAAFEHTLHSEDPREQEAHESELLRLARSAWPYLVLKVDSSDPRVATTALKLLEQLRLPETIPYLERRLGGAAWRDREIYHTLARLDLSGSSAALLKGLEDQARQPLVLAAIVGVPARRSVPLLLSAYPRLSTESRPSADALLLADAPVTAQVLRRNLRSLDRASLTALSPLFAKLDLEDAVPILVDIARASASPAVVFESLGRMKGPSLLRKILDQPAAKVLVYLQARGAESTLELARLAIDPDARIAQAATLLLAEVDGPRTAEIFRPLLARAATRTAAIRALAKIGAADLLLGALRKSPSTVDLLAAVVELRSVELLDQVLRIAADQGVPAETLASALSGRPQELTVPPLISRLADRDGRSQVHDLLKKLTGQKFPARASSWEAWWRKQHEG